jgi:hypothetical protein
MKPVRQQFDCDDRVDDTAVFFSRMFGERRIVIIPKELFTLDETEIAYVLTLKEHE